MDLKQIKRGIVILFLVFLLPACDQPQATKNYPLHYSDAIMGTRFTIKVSNLPSALTSDVLKIQIKDLLDSLNSQMSTYRADSELSQINSNQSNQWLTVSDSLYTVLKKATEIAELSHGAFDISVGALVNLWGFGPDPMSFVAPKDEVIHQALRRMGYQHLLFDETTQTIKKEFPDLYLDLSAIAKGYAVDQVGLLLEKHGIVDYMIEIGGELRLKGYNLEKLPWRIAIEKPTAEQRMIQKVISLTDISLATSGDYRNFFEVDEIRFSHTIDPRSGRPITHKLASITVLSDTTMEADGWATALMVLGLKQGVKLAEEKKIAALFIIKTKEGFIEKASSFFNEKLR